MVNSTHVTHFTLTAYFDSGLLKYLYSVILATLYVSIIAANVLLIVVICVNRSLHEPMYIFLCSLSVIQLYGSTGLFPFLVVQILSENHDVPTSVCFLQIFCLHSYGLVEVFILSAMSYDRYVAICHPLQYHTRMTRYRTTTLIAVLWFYGFFACSVMVSLSSSLQLCGNIINKVYCDNYPVVKLACSDTTALNIYGLIISFINVFSPLAFIVYTYMRILKVCFSGSKQTRLKAVSTCTPHIASLLNFILGASFEIVQSRFNMNHVPNVLRIFLSLYFITCQPLFNPLMYGLNILQIRIKRCLGCHFP
uniref:Olfactory receptor n=1 Tax=Sphaeramia orbicularis TaxID=375764 RepID=A0A672Z7C0_9TELE